jgi:hypothetical protein
MAWHIGNQKVVHHEDFNQILKQYDGKYLDEHEAKISLAKFLKTNLGTTFQMLTQIELEPFQELMLKGLIEADNSLVVAGRGVSKSFLISALCLLTPIFAPYAKVCIISANFRSSRRILEQCEKWIKDKKGFLARACFTNDMRKANDIFKWVLPNGAEIFALPLSTGEGLRGTRATHLIVDEGLLISKEIQDSIIRPFLTAKQNFQEQKKIREAEDYLISQGAITEKDRFIFPRNKYMVFSSASYQFEYLYEMYQTWVGEIEKPPKDDPNPPRYFVMRMGYEAVPANSFLDLTQINAAKANGGENSDYFKREYRAIFSDAGDSYFNPKRMHECTIPIGDYPTIQVKGDKDAEYLLAIDPAYGDNKSNDFFGMAVYMLNPKERSIVLVHSYAKAGVELKEHFQYLTYLITHFNIVWTMIDASGDEFIKGYNESTLAKDRNLKLEILETNFDKADNYVEEMSKCKREYNLTGRRYVYAQRFTSENNRKMNEFLHNQIEAKKCWFASAITNNEDALKKAMVFQFPFSFYDKHGKEFGLIEYLEDQDYWIKETKSQTALIEVKSTALGSLQYDLPQHMRRSDNPNRPRKDLYTCLLLANYGAKFYFDMLFTDARQVQSYFTPILIR